MLNNQQSFIPLLEIATQDTGVTQNQRCFGSVKPSHSPSIPHSHTSSQHSEQQCFPPESCENIVRCYLLFLFVCFVVGFFFAVHSKYQCERNHFSLCIQFQPPQVCLKRGLEIFYPQESSHQVLCQP